MVHTAVAFAKRRNRLRDVGVHDVDRSGRDEHDHRAPRRRPSTACPVLLLPGDIFASRRPIRCCSNSSRPGSRDVSVNDCFKPVSRYWDRINRPEQLVTALLEAMRVLTSPADTGAVTLALPQDVQAEAFDYPVALFARASGPFRARVPIATRCGAAAALHPQRAAAARHRGRRRPLQRSHRRARARSSRPRASPSPRRRRARAASRPTIRSSSDRWASRAASRRTAWRATPTSSSLVGTRLTDFTTASRTAFHHPDVTVHRHQRHRARRAESRRAAARGRRAATLDELRHALAGWRVPVRIRDARRRAQARVGRRESTRIVAPRQWTRC